MNNDVTKETAPDEFAETEDLEIAFVRAEIVRLCCFDDPGRDIIHRMPAITEMQALVLGDLLDELDTLKEDVEGAPPPDWAMKVDTALFGRASIVRRVCMRPEAIKDHGQLLAISDLVQAVEAYEMMYRRNKTAAPAGAIADNAASANVGDSQMTNIVNIKPTVTFTAEVDAETAKLVADFVAKNQHPTRNSHGPMTPEILVRLLVEDVAAAMRDGNTWQGGHMSLVLGEHGYRT